ncbi:hypothetical protein CAPTEDRAFT_196018 [Capitella teleta]|uniref:VWFD domain-containing protein n=1 Tax=Capitella teleta TaxID=283909 RepID=R7VBA8_CAPTE|nr:hypothetical protein CAPTEDRAFT_196018 [Capitella teleta]|eukprot:ELU15909.1 hypothetical protein CAPTEDRAFT_196018 [Capitella teleta]
MLDLNRSVAQPTVAPTTVATTPHDSVCMCWGDPHCRGFAIPKFSLSSSCAYLLASDNCQGPFWTFQIYARLHMGNHSSVHSVIVDFNGIRAEFKQNLVLKIANISYQDDFNDTASGFLGTFYENATAEFGGNWKPLVRMPNGVRIAWDGRKQVAIYISNWFENILCGLCGRIWDTKMYIGQKDSSKTFCPNKPVSKPRGSTTNDVEEYVNSHLLAVRDSGCKNECD